MNLGDIYLVKGRTGIISRLVRYFTRSKFSHGGIYFAADCGAESNYKGVRYENISQYSNLTILTPVEPLTLNEQIKLREFIVDTINKKTKYDFWGILGFLTFKRWQEKNKYYCFEFIWDAYKHIGRELGRLDNDYVDGRLIYSSLKLKEI